MQWPQAAGTSLLPRVGQGPEPGRQQPGHPTAARQPVTADRGKGGGTSVSQIFSSIIQAFLTFSVWLWRLNPYLLQATKKGSSITIQKSHKFGQMHFGSISIRKAPKRI